MNQDKQVVDNFISGHLPINNSTSNESQNAPVPKDVDSERAKNALDHAKGGAVASAPIVTGIGLAMMFSPGHDRFGISDVIRILGFPVAVGGLVIDTVKLPFTATYSVGALFWAGILKFKSLFTRPNKDEQQTREIMESFAHRFANTMQLLVAMNLETPESIVDKFDKYQTGKSSREFAALCALTTLNTAYASRALLAPSILLANGKVLHRQNCPKQGLDIFESVLEIRNVLRQLNLHRKNNREATPIVLQWVPILKQALENKDYQIDSSLDKNTRDMLTNLVTLLRQIGKRATSKKPLKQKATSLQNDSLTSAQQVPYRVIVSTQNLREQTTSTQQNEQTTSTQQNEQTRSTQHNEERLIDPQTHEVIIDAVVGSNGLLYNHSTAQTLLSSRTITRFIKFYSAGGPNQVIKNSEELTIDPITCNDIEKPVVANDGRVYDEETALNLIQNHAIGVGGQVLTDYINCPSMAYW